MSSHHSYTLAQICQNGHVISTNIKELPESDDYCTICGSKIFSECSYCSSPIRGRIKTDFFKEYLPNTPYRTSFTDIPKPLYCYKCGKSYPWTELSINSISDILLELDDLNSEEVQRVIDVIPDIVIETPKTDLAKVRLQKLFKGAKSQTVSILQNMIANFACEAIKLFFNL